MTLVGFDWACVWKGRVLAGEGDHFPTRSGFNQGPSLVSALWARGFGQDFATTGGWGVGCGSAGQHSQAVAGRAQQSNVRALPHTYSRSSGVVRVLDVRIDWHVKRPTINKVKRRAVRSQAGGGQSDDSRSSACSCSCWGALEQQAAWSY